MRAGEAVGLTTDGRTGTVRASCRRISGNSSCIASRGGGHRGCRTSGRLRRGRFSRDHQVVVRTVTEAVYDRQNFSRKEMILQEFAFLERDFGCAPPDIRLDTYSLIVIWAATACKVVIIDDLREGFDLLVLPGLDRPGGYHYRIFAIKHYREHGDLNDYRRAARAWKRPWNFREELTQNAAWVREYAADILRGDPSLYRGFDEAYRRVLEAQENQRAEPGDMSTKVP